MLASPGRMPSDDDRWGFEINWAGERVIALCDTGHLTLLDAAGDDLRPRLPELAAITLGLGGEPVALDGVVAVLGDGAAGSPGRSSAASRRAPTPRSGAGAATPRRR